MNDPERPPLPAIVYEQIEVMLYMVDQRHWPLVAAMRVPIFIPPLDPVPPRQPLQLLNRLQVYAGDLYKAEADQYGQFSGFTDLYSAWLSKLSDRVLARVVANADKIDKENPNKMLGFHGLSLLEINKGLREFLTQLEQYYIWKDLVPTTPAPTADTATPAASETQVHETTGVAQRSEREILRDSYRATFPDVKIQDICWAAEQTYREWKRWISGEAKDGSKPDRTFRHVLTSGKKPEEVRRKPRPTKYNV
jgi:hypothetical protein